MKTKSILAALLLLVSGLQSAKAQKMTVNLVNGQSVEYNVSQVESVTFTEGGETGAYEWVDLGLPSGTLWATFNVGANSPEEYGDYFAWGETAPKSDYTWGTYKYCNGSFWTLTKYCSVSDDGIVDNLKDLLPEDDAATVNWGKDWQMPTETQFYELMSDNCTTKEWKTWKGVNGLLLTGKGTGKSIFLPIGGYYDDHGLNYLGSDAYYWSHSLDAGGSSGASYLYIGYGEQTFIDGNFRSYGQCVRPVYVGKVDRIPVTSISLNYTSITLQPNTTEHLIATVEPADADNTAVTWFSDDESVAKVTEDGWVIAISEGNCIVYCYAADGSGVVATCEVNVSAHEWVDLGLPSGTLWATCNVGASKAEEYGDYFAWGETEPKTDYNWNTYKHSTGTYPSDPTTLWLTKYCINGNHGYNGFTDGITELLPEDDAATVNWGDGWEMPSRRQFEELFNSSYTTLTWTEENGVNGYKITSKINGSSVFLPAGGYYDYTSLIFPNGIAFYWSRSLYKDNSYDAYNMGFNEDTFGWSSGTQRYLGSNVRPVRVEQAVHEGHDYVEIGGLKWATMNVGATTVAGSYETCSGDYFAWGETEPRYESITRTWSGATFTWKDGYESGYSRDNYPSYMGETLDAAHDAATANWGGNWRTPTKEDFEALAKACSYSGDWEDPYLLNWEVETGGVYWLEDNQTYEPDYTGVAGILFVSADDISKRVFFPAAGSIGSMVSFGVNTYGSYWSSLLDTSDTEKANYLIFEWSNIELVSDRRHFGFTVRPVSE